MLVSAWKRSASDGNLLIQTPERRTELIATAQAHFTAALAAATALGAPVDDGRGAGGKTGMDQLDHLAWDKVAGVQPS